MEIVSEITKLVSVCFDNLLAFVHSLRTLCIVSIQTTIHITTSDSLDTFQILEYTAGI